MVRSYFGTERILQHVSAVFLIEVNRHDAPDEGGRTSTFRPRSSPMDLSSRAQA